MRCEKGAAGVRHTAGGDQNVPAGPGTAPPGRDLPGGLRHGAAPLHGGPCAGVFRRRAGLRSGRDAPRPDAPGAHRGGARRAAGGDRAGGPGSPARPRRYDHGLRRGAVRLLPPGPRRPCGGRAAHRGPHRSVSRGIRPAGRGSGEPVLFRPDGHGPERFAPGGGRTRRGSFSPATRSWTRFAIPRGRRAPHRIRPRTGKAR